MALCFAVEELVAGERGMELEAVGSSWLPVAEVHTTTSAAAEVDDFDMPQKLVGVACEVLAAAVEAYSHPFEVLDLYSSLPCRCQCSVVPALMQY